MEIANWKNLGRRMRKQNDIKNEMMEIYIFKKKKTLGLSGLMSR